MNLTVNPILSSIANIAVCNSELPYTWNGLTFNSAGSQTATLSSVITGCDSLATLILTVNSQSIGDTFAIACESFNWYGSTLTSSGTSTYLVSNSLGCDSLVTLHLTINHTSSSTLIDTGSCIYLWNGEQYIESGIYNYITTNAQGCDSIVELILHIHSCNESIDSSVIFVPNVFTPNGDLLNDTFEIIIYQGLVESGYIFNRWGEIVTEFSENNLKWDGVDYRSGKPVNDGIYTFLITYKPTYSQSKLIHGFINIIR